MLRENIEFIPQAKPAKKEPGLFSRGVNKARLLYGMLSVFLMTMIMSAQAQIVAYDGTNVTFTPSSLVNDIIDAIVTGIVALTSLWLLVIGFRKMMGFIRRG